MDTEVRPGRAAQLLLFLLSLFAITTNKLITPDDDDAISKFSRRRRLDPKPMNSTTQAQYMQAYLGGLIPAVDSNILPLYLRDTYDVNNEYTMDLYDGTGNPKLRNKDLVFFWHIPKASGSTMKNIMNFCFDLRRAEQLKPEPSMEYARPNILNMDTTSPKGLKHAFSNGVADSNMVDLIVSNYFLSGAALFTDMHFGKTFTILRHPVELAISLFYYRRKATWERSYRPAWTQLTFHDFVSSEHYMDNWMTRQLTGTMPWITLEDKHLERAKLMMREKIFIGLLSEMDETLRQLKAHFGWEEKEPYCAFNYLHSKPTNQNSHPDIPGGRGGATWKLVAEKDKWDMGLYYYGLELFAEQSNKYPSDDSTGNTEKKMKDEE